MASKRGVLIDEVQPGSAAEAAGIRKGDRLLSINGAPVLDVIDYMFQAEGPDVALEISRGGKRFSKGLALEESDTPGLVLSPFRIKTCRNKCVFCFVSQLPKGLRKSLYVKDEDYRMSFLYGNYMTLTNLSPVDRERIATQRLSPLYISVHTTNDTLRRRMLGNPKAPDIMKELRFFKENKIRMHTQIVLCPGLNDYDELKNTIRDLCSLYPFVESIAVVPVGITAHGGKGLSEVRKEDAERAIREINVFRKRFMKKHGDPVVYAADELYIKAGAAFPPLKEYGELPQIENGVGMLPLFLAEAKKARIPETPAPLKAITFTGTSFYPYLEKFTERLSRRGIKITPVEVKNHFFGETVTVAGLITGRDVIRTLMGKSGEFDILLVPSVALKAGEDVFLDSVTAADLQDALGIKAVIIEPTPEGLIEGVYG